MSADSEIAAFAKQGGTVTLSLMQYETLKERSVFLRKAMEEEAQKREKAEQDLMDYRNKVVKGLRDIVKLAGEIASIGKRDDCQKHSQTVLAKAEIIYSEAIKLNCIYGEPGEEDKA